MDAARLRAAEPHFEADSADARSATPPKRRCSRARRQKNKPMCRTNELCDRWRTHIRSCDPSHRLMATHVCGPGRQPLAACNRVVPRVVRTKRGQSVHFWQCAKIALGAPLVLQVATRSADETHSSVVGTCGYRGIASASSGAAACDCERDPKRAQQRPSNANVGV